MPNIIKATNLTVSKVFPKFFIAQDTFKKQDGSEGKQSYKIWWNKSAVSEGAKVNVVGAASATVNQFDKDGQQITVGQLNINATEIDVVSAKDNWDTF